MKTSEQIGDLAAALAAAQAEFKPVPKSRQGHHGSYADLADVVASTQPITGRHGLAVVQSDGLNDAGFEVLTTLLMHSSGQWISDEMPLHPVKNDPQAQGSAITYARRYSYCAMLGVVADEDDDGEKATAAAKGTPRKASAPKKRPENGNAPLCPICEQPIAGKPVTKQGAAYAHKSCVEAAVPA